MDNFQWHYSNVTYLEVYVQICSIMAKLLILIALTLSDTNDASTQNCLAVSGHAPT